MTKNTPFDGKMFVFTAPSGAGKTTIVRHLLKTFDFLDFSVSATTRKKRPKEKNGKDYYFLSVDEFNDLKRRRKFVEWEEVYDDQYYGTLKSEVSRLWELKKHIVFDIDVRGARDIKRKYRENCLAIFVKPPNLEIHIERLKNRKTESEDSLKKRISRIKREMRYEKKFDRVLVNDDLQTALTNAEKLITEFLENAESDDREN